jgi:hypothetical protein
MSNGTRINFKLKHAHCKSCQSAEKQWSPLLLYQESSGRNATRLMALSAKKPSRFILCACFFVTTTCFVMTAVIVLRQHHHSFHFNLSWMNIKTLHKHKLRKRSDIYTRKQKKQQQQYHQLLSLLLQTTLCADRCESDCVVYKTPWMACYNGQTLFPNDPSWSKWDILDIPLASTIIGVVDNDNVSPPDMLSFRRFFFSTQNTSCASTPTDIYTLPLNACLGPFGAPRPWGNFTTGNTTSTTVAAVSTVPNASLQSLKGDKNSHHEYPHSRQLHAFSWTDGNREKGWCQMMPSKTHL